MDRSVYAGLNEQPSEPSLEPSSTGSIVNDITCASSDGAHGWYIVA